MTKCILKCRKKIYKQPCQRLCFSLHYYLLNVLLKTVFFFLWGTGQRNTMEVSGKTLLIFSHNDWWLPALFFLCGDSHRLSAAIRDHIQGSLFIFRCREEFQVFTNSSSLLHTDTSFFQSIFRRSKILVLTVPVPYMGTVWKLSKLLQ